MAQSPRIERNHSFSLEDSASNRYKGVNRLRLALSAALVFVFGMQLVILTELMAVESNTPLASLGTSAVNPKPLPPNQIPPNFIINTKSGAHTESPLLQQNILRNLHFFPEYKFISDNDESCLQKIKDTRIFSPEIITKWYSNQSTPGMYKSDACRLAQVYLHGGVYLDNDLQVTTSMIELVKGGHEVITCINVGGVLIFNAILAAPPGHVLIQRSMEIMQSLIQKQDFKQNIGPVSLRMAMNELYKLSNGAIDRQTMSKKGVLLLQEQTLNPINPLMQHRTSEKFCNIAFVGLNGKVYGFSRVKQWNSVDKKC